MSALGMNTGEGGKLRLLHQSMLGFTKETTGAPSGMSALGMSTGKDGPVMSMRPLESG